MSTFDFIQTLLGMALTQLNADGSQGLSTRHSLWRDHLSRQHVRAMPRPRHSKHVFCKASVNLQRPIGVRRGPCLVGKSPVMTCHLMQSRDNFSWISRRQSQQVKSVNAMVRSGFMGVLGEAKQKH